MKSVYGGKEMRTQQKITFQYFQKIFDHRDAINDISALNCLSPTVTEEDNTMLTSIPVMVEVKNIIFSTNPKRAPGPDGLNALFYQVCWAVISEGVCNAIVTYLRGGGGVNFPKFFTRTYIVMIAKVDFPYSLTDLRPISLYNVSSESYQKC